jgi:hypothetical protein
MCSFIPPSSLTIFIVVLFLNDSHSDWDEMESQSQQQFLFIYGFMSLFSIYTSSENGLFNLLAHLLTGFFSFGVSAS